MKSTDTKESHPTRFNPVDKAVMRKFNEAIVLNLIRECAPISRAGLARSIGLRESTISSIVKDLVADGLVYEDRLGESTGGRKPRLLRLDGKRSVTVGITIGVDKTTIALSTFTGKIFHKTQFQTDKDPTLFLPQFSGRLKAMLARIEGERNIQGFGVSLPGLIDPLQGRVIYSANLGWKNVLIGPELVEQFGLEIGRNLFFEDDVRAAALAQVMFGNLKGLRQGDAVSILVNEGLGTGIIIGRQLYCGYNLGAGQFGHISLQEGGPECSCGNLGCWELYCSDPATIRRYLGSLTTQEAQAAKDIHIEDLIRLARAGDENAIKAIQETGKYFGKGISMVVNALNPEIIVLNGHISEAWNLIEGPILEVVRKRALPPNLERLEIVPSSIEENPCLIGAISLVLSKNFVMPRIM